MEASILGQTHKGVVLGLLVQHDDILFRPLFGQIGQVNHAVPAGRPLSHECRVPTAFGREEAARSIVGNKFALDWALFQLLLQSREKVGSFGHGVLMGAFAVQHGRWAA